MKAWERYIGVDPEICFGRPFVKGTRVPLWAVFSMLAAGVPVEQVREEYRLTDEQMRAAFAWATHLARRKRSLKSRQKVSAKISVAGGRRR
jgi:uncharacterized protein (DUF433 family)